MKRRAFISLIGGVAAMPLAAHAQRATRMLRVGCVTPQPINAPHIVAFLLRLTELGYEEGRNLTFDYIEATSIGAIQSGYRDLAARKADIFVAAGVEFSLKSALAAASQQPIVMIAINYDPFALGYVTSLAQPGGNITGVYFQQLELTIKRMQLVKDAFPEMQAATMLWDQTSADQWEAARGAAEKLGLRLVGAQLRGELYDYDNAFAEVPTDYRRFLLVPASPFLFRDRARLGDFVRRHPIVSMFAFRDYVEAGGLLGYAPSLGAMHRLAAEYVDKIARGAKPAELPIQQATKFELVVNLKTAKAIGIEVPPSILLRADEVFE